MKATNKKIMIDFWAGFGGMSEAFHQSPGWAVLRIDNNPLLEAVPNMILADCMTLEPFSLGTSKVDYVHCSFPCLEFSQAFNAPGPTARRAGFDFKPDLKPAKRALWLIRKLNPKYWSIENVKGSIPHLTPLLGEPSMILGSHVFWGNFPRFEYTHELEFKKDMDKRHSPLRANYRAKIPFNISRSMLKCIDEQKSITDYLD